MLIVFLFLLTLVIKEQKNSNDIMERYQKLVLQKNEQIKMLDRQRLVAENELMGLRAWRRRLVKPPTIIPTRCPVVAIDKLNNIRFVLDRDNIDIKDRWLDPLEIFNAIELDKEPNNDNPHM